MKLRPFLSLLIAIALVFVSAAAAGAYWIAAHRPTVEIQHTRVAQPTTTVFVSAKAPVVVSLLTNPDRLKAAQLLAAPAPQRQLLRDRLHQLQEGLLPDAQLSYGRDIQPWLGNEITLALTTPDLDYDGSNGDQAGYLMVATASDPALAKQKLQAFWRRHVKAKNLVMESYAGAQIFYRQSAALPGRSNRPQPVEEKSSVPVTLASAVVGNQYVLLANSPKVLRDAINNVQVSELNLFSRDAYQQVVAELPEQAIGFTWVNLPQLLSRATGKAEPVGLPYLNETLFAHWNLETAPETAGWFAETLLLTDAEKLTDTPAAKLPQISAPPNTLRFIPTGSAFVAAGSDLPALWSQLEADRLNRSSLTALIQQPLERLQQQWNISLPEDVLSWMTGEYALGLVPRPDRPQSDWVLVAQRSPETTAGLEKLDAIAQKHNVTRGSFTLETPLGTQEIFAWTKFSTKPTRSRKTPAAGLLALETEVQGVHTTIGDYEVFATSLEAMELALQPPEASLLASAEFQQAIAPLAQPNHGYVYFNATGLHQIVQSLPGTQSLLSATRTPLEELLHPLRSLVFSHYRHEAKGSRGNLSVQFDSAQSQ